MEGFPGFVSGRVVKANKATQTDLLQRTFKFRATSAGNKVTFYNINIRLLPHHLSNAEIVAFLSAVESPKLLTRPKTTHEKRDEHVVCSDHQQQIGQQQVGRPQQVGGPQTEYMKNNEEVVLIDVSDEDTDSDSDAQDDGQDNIDECGVCRMAEPDSYIVGCRHAFCYACLDTIKKTKPPRKKCPKCFKGWRKVLPLDEDWSACDARPKNRCGLCEKGPLNRVLACGHLFCKECIDQLKAVEGRPRCPKCNVRFLKFKTVYF